METISWTPLITAAHFDGPKADLLTTVAGMVTLLLILAGFGILYKVFH